MSVHFTNCIILSLVESNKHFAHLETYKRVRVAQVKAELKAHEDFHIDIWNTLQNDVPYKKSSHPFRDYFAFAFEMLRGELQMWGTLLASTTESALVFIAIADAVVFEFQRLLGPLLLENNDKAASPNQILRNVSICIVRNRGNLDGLFYHSIARQIYF